MVALVDISSIEIVDSKNIQMSNTITQKSTVVEITVADMIYTVVGITSADMKYTVVGITGADMRD